MTIEANPLQTQSAERSAAKELQKVAVGRMLLGALRGNADILTEMLECHEADYANERAGLLYLPEEAIGRFAGKTIMGKQPLTDAIERLGDASRSPLQVVRKNITLYPVNQQSTKADYYRVSALMQRAFDEKGATRLPYFEKKMLEKTFGVRSGSFDPPLSFGILKLPYGSPDKEALKEMFNDLYPTHLHVGRVQILDKR